MPSGAHGYTFFGGPGNFNLKTNGCYLPTDAQGSYPVAVKMVGTNCEDVHVTEDTAYVSTPDEPEPEPDPQFLTVIARDASQSPVSGVQIKVDGSSKGYTGSDGSFQTLLNANESYHVTGTAPGTHICVDCSENITITNDPVLVNFSLREEDVPVVPGGYLHGVTGYREDGKIKLMGFAKGLSAGTGFCLEYTCPSLGISDHVRNPQYGFTKFTGPGDYNLAATGCYIPDHGDRYYSIILNAVDGQCEAIIDLLDYASFTLEPAEPDPPATAWLTIRTHDTNGQDINDVAINIKQRRGVHPNIEILGEWNLVTGSPGMPFGHTQIELPRGVALDNEIYIIRAETPAGYTAEVSHADIELFDDTSVSFIFEEQEQEPQCKFDIYVKGIERNLTTGAETDLGGIPGAAVAVVTVGTEYNEVSGSDGHVTVDVYCGETYRIAATKTGFEGAQIFNQSVDSGTADKTLVIIKEVMDEPCPAPNPAFSIDRTVAGVGERFVVQGWSQYQGYAQPNHHWTWGDGGFGTDATNAHAYDAPGEYVITHEVGILCSDETATETITVTVAEEGTHTLSAPSAARVNTDFMVIVSSDPDTEFVILDITTPISHPEIGRGTTGADGRVSINCRLSQLGEAQLQGYAECDPSIPGGLETNVAIINITSAPPPTAEPEFMLKVPKLVMAGEIEFTGTAPPGAEVKIKVKKVGSLLWIWEIDALAPDTVIATVTADAQGKYSGSFEIDELGSVTVYAAIQKSWLDIEFPDWFPDIAGDDLETEMHDIIVITTIVVASLLIAVLLVVEKRYTMIGLFKRRR